MYVAIAGTTSSVPRHLFPSFCILLRLRYNIADVRDPHVSYFNKASQTLPFLCLPSDPACHGNPMQRPRFRLINSVYQQSVSISGICHTDGLQPYIFIIDIIRRKLVQFIIKCQYLQVINAAYVEMLKWVIQQVTNWPAISLKPPYFHTCFYFSDNIWCKHVGVVNIWCTWCQ